MRPTHHARHRCAQNADPFSHNRRYLTVFTQRVCTLATAPPRTAAAPPPIGGNCNIRGATRRRHADSQLLMLQNPHRHQCRARCRGRGSGWGAGGWRKPGNCTHGRCHGETNLAQQEPRRAASVQNSPSTPLAPHVRDKTLPAHPSHRMCGTKLSQHTPSHRMCGTKLSQHEPHGPTSGTKLSLFTRNGSIWRFFYMQGEFCTVVTAKKLSRENFVPNARQRRGSPTQQHTKPHLCGGRRQGLVQTNFACNSKTQVTQRRRPIRTSAMPEGNCMRN